MPNLESLPNPGGPSPDVEVKRFRDAALLLRANDMPLPPRDEFGVTWTFAMVGREQIEVSADRLREYSYKNDVPLKDRMRAISLAENLSEVATHFNNEVKEV